MGEAELDRAPSAIGIERRPPPLAGLAEAVSRAVCGFSEIEGERHRAAHPEATPWQCSRSRVPPPSGPGSAPGRGPPAAGIAYVTTRRIGEDLGLTGAEARTLLGTLRAEARVRQAPPLWRLAAATAATQGGSSG
ncbi:hypothetical protein ACWDYJ_12825 [Streptomyces sp. NPDC003042]